MQHSPSANPKTVLPNSVAEAQQKKRFWGCLIGCVGLAWGAAWLLSYLAQPKLLHAQAEQRALQAAVQTCIAALSQPTAQAEAAMHTAVVHDRVCRAQRDRFFMLELFAHFSAVDSAGLQLHSIGLVGPRLTIAGRARDAQVLAAWVRQQMDYPKFIDPQLTHIQQASSAGVLFRFEATVYR